MFPLGFQSRLCEWLTLHRPMCFTNACNRAHVVVHRRVDLSVPPIYVFTPKKVSFPDFLGGRVRMAAASLRGQQGTTHRS